MTSICEVKNDLMDAYLRSESELRQAEEAWQQEPGRSFAETDPVTAARTKVVLRRKAMLDQFREHGC